MDIERPPLEAQVEPAPWLVARRNVDVAALVDRILENCPDASPDEVLGTLAEWNVQANGLLVAQQVLEHRRRRAGSGLAPAERKTTRREGRKPAPAGTV